MQQASGAKSEPLASLLTTSAGLIDLSLTGSNLDAFALIASIFPLAEYTRKRYNIVL